MVTGKNGCNSCTDYWSCLLHLNQQWPSTFSIWNYDSLHPHCDFTSLSTAFVQPLLVPFLSLLCVFFFLVGFTGYIYSCEKTKMLHSINQIQALHSTLASRQEDESSGPGHQSVPPSEVSGEKTSFFDVDSRLLGWMGKRRQWFTIYIYIHPWNLTWNLKMMVWKIIFLSKWLISRFYVNLPGCIYKHSI